MEISSIFSPKVGREALIFLPKIRISCRANYNYSKSNNERDQCINFYEVLSLESKNVGYEEIKKAYRRMALQYHPDICSDPSTKEESTQRFVELQRAYETLSDPISRYNYDYELLGLCVDDDDDDDHTIRRSSFPKEIWENQLSGLKRRSQIRMQRKQKG